MDRSFHLQSTMKVRYLMNTKRCALRKFEQQKQRRKKKEMFIISQRYFGLHEDHLRDEANDIAKESGAWHVNYTDPRTGLKRGWFASSTLNGAHNGDVEQNVMRKVQAIGGFEALRTQ
jgi:hypothetical protein